MGVVSLTPVTFEVPGESGKQIKVKQLNWLELQEAKTIEFEKAVSLAKAVTGLNEMLEARRAQKQAAPAESTKADEFGLYDQATLLKHGLVGWTYDGEPDYRRFDPKTAEWAARKVFEISVLTEDASKES